jgi:hypothetical protein
MGKNSDEALQYGPASFETRPLGAAGFVPPTSDITHPTQLAGVSISVGYLWQPLFDYSGASRAFGKSWFSGPIASQQSCCGVRRKRPPKRLSILPALASRSILRSKRAASNSRRRTSSAHPLVVLLRPFEVFKGRHDRKVTHPGLRVTLRGATGTAPISGGEANRGGTC